MADYKDYIKVFDSIKKVVDTTEMKTFGIRINDILGTAKKLNVEIRPEEKEYFLEELNKYFLKFGIYTSKSETKGEEALLFEKRYDEPCTELFLIIWDSTYKLMSYGKIYRDVYSISEDVRSIIENEMYKEVLHLLDHLKKFNEMCDIDIFLKDEINRTIEEFGSLKYIDFVGIAHGLSLVLVDTVFPMINIKRRNRL